jgi:hypothetical protein
LRSTYLLREKGAGLRRGSPQRGREGKPRRASRDGGSHSCLGPAASAKRRTAAVCPAEAAAWKPASARKAGSAPAPVYRRRRQPLRLTFGAALRGHAPPLTPPTGGRRGPSTAPPSQGRRSRRRQARSCRRWQPRTPSSAPSPRGRGRRSFAGASGSRAGEVRPRVVEDGAYAPCTPGAGELA